MSLNLVKDKETITKVYTCIQRLIFKRMNMRRFKKISTLPLISRGIFSVRYSEGEEDRVVHTISDYGVVYAL